MNEVATIRRTVLVVDDNAASRYSTSRFLRGAGFEVLESKTGHEALAAATRQPDAIVLDINLPDIDGFEVCRVLRKDPVTAHIPVIHLSATFVSTGDRVHGLNAGADGYLTHPVEPTVLVATVNAFVRARAAEERLRESEQKFRTIFNQAANGLALVTETLSIIDANQAMCKLFQRKREDVVGEQDPPFFDPALLRGHPPLAETVEREGVWKAQFSLRQANGHSIETEWAVSAYTEPGVWLAVVSDMSERLAAEEAKERLLSSERAARAEAERANRSKDEFLATISHELRTPLHAIVGWSHLLKRHQVLDPATINSGLDAIERNGKIQADLISDLLDVARITSGKLRLDLQPAAIQPLVRMTLDNLMPQALAKGLQLVSELEASDEHVMADAGRVQQILTNLLTNAVKFTPAGGIIRVTLRRDGSDVMLSVADTGEGITSEFLPHIFETFRQENAATNRVHQGLGLGLAIVRKLVELHGGAVHAESPGMGLGATFTVRFPRTAAKDPQALTDVLATCQSDPQILVGAPVLIVEDDADSRVVLRRVLEESGMIVDEAQSAQEALDRMKQRAPSVVITDIGMPEEDGFHLLKSIRQFSAVPVVALTAFARLEDRAFVLSSGFQAYLSKPLDVDALLNTLCVVLSKLDASPPLSAAAFADAAKP